MDPSSLATLLMLFVLLVVPAESGNPPAIYVFGDSIFDVGNNNYFKNGIYKANLPYYGIDFPGGVPTGRFSNGYNLADLLAQKLGFDKSPPASLSLSKSTLPLKGINYASGGAGILDSTGGNSSIPISSQVLQFKETTKALAKQLGQESAAKHLSESMFLFSTGSNDLIVTAFTYGYQNKTVRKDFVNLLASDYKDQLKEIYNFGARKMAIINVGSIGCVPLIRNTKKSGNCNNKFNKFAGELDKAVTEMLQDLSSTCKGLKYSYIKTDVIGSLIASKFRKYGFVQTISACCGTGRFNAQGFCTPSANLCPNRDQYFFWDPVHPTQAFYKLQADFAYTGNSSVAIPINVKELAGI